MRYHPWTTLLIASLAASAGAQAQPPFEFEVSAKCLVLTRTGHSENGILETPQYIQIDSETKIPSASLVFVVFDFADGAQNPVDLVIWRSEGELSMERVQNKRLDPAQFQFKNQKGLIRVLKRADVRAFYLDRGAQAMGPAPGISGGPPGRSTSTAMLPPAFYARPRVTLVPVLESLLSPAGMIGMGPIDSGEGAPKPAPAFHWRFGQPAHFPLPRPGWCNQVFPGEGAVIYEGMSFSAWPDGRYEVSLTTSTPAMPVTVRLQMLVSDHRNDWFTLTLPPVPIDPEMGSRDAYQSGGWQVRRQGNYGGASWQVWHEGHSHEIAERFSFLTAVSRHGTARFGSMPQ